MTYKEIKQMYGFRNYTFLKNPLELNIFGVRSQESRSNKFDDTIGCAYLDENGREQVKLYTGTTDPGKYWLQNPMRKEGCLILVPGQYLNVYAIGPHNGKYTALRQVRKMQYVRDNDKNIELDFSLYRDPVKKAKFAFWDICFSNLHRASEFQVLQFVEKYSAGCQVIQSAKNFNELMTLVFMSRDITKNNTFNYTLFEK